MPATLDPATALVLIDLQHGITDMPTAHPSEEIVARCAQIVLGGISTSIGVESTARAANERGYELTIVTDAVTDPDEVPTSTVSEPSSQESRNWPLPKRCSPP
jgi:nicotinamidase-related amidase